MAQSAQYIAARAAAMGLDPQAVLAVARMEGLGGGVGDNGTSFGPWQLHIGGAMPSGIANPQQWAWSKQGIDYALQRIAGVARGQHGAQAIQSIVSRFERPANPAAEIAGAESVYGGNIGSSPKLRAMQAMVGGAGGSGGNAGLSNQMSQMLLQEGMQAIAGSTNPEQQGQSLLQLALARKAMGAGGLSGPAPLNIGGFQFHGVKGGSKADQAAVKLASSFIGTPYVWGGASPGGFDCSGLLQYTWSKLGVKIPRTTYDQWKVGRAVPSSQLRPGDAVFFKGSDSVNGLPGHVAMYIGGGRIIQSPHTGAHVEITNLKNMPGYMGARRYR